MKFKSSGLSEIEKDCQLLLEIHYNFYLQENADWKNFKRFIQICEEYLPNKNIIVYKALRQKLIKDGYICSIGDIEPLLSKVHSITEEGVIFYKSGGYYTKYKEEQRKKNFETLTLISSLIAAFSAFVTLYTVFKPEENISQKYYTKSQVDSLLLKNKKFKKNHNSSGELNTAKNTKPKNEERVIKE